ncbi:hypothetical protein ACHHYP_20029 [Achlya hypogyna]|uniref:Uncharacterized protein n=1 Tax=Achlya hypogyna TaxID=1202772 RepID=A0A1V9ZTV8_ACHHY|nr:hypothetical protein ACHHYP_20029 [Achlya hypogyna]
MSAFSSSEGAVSGHDSDADSAVSYSKSLDSFESGSVTAPSTPKSNEYSDGSSSDDEPLSIFKEGVRKRRSSRATDDDDELALAESNSEDEHCRRETLRDYSYEGELEVLHVPRMVYPFPSYLRQIATEIAARTEHPLLSAPLAFATCQNLPLYLSRRASDVSLGSPRACKRTRSSSFDSELDTSDASMLSDN